MNFQTFQSQLDQVKELKNNADYEAFDRLVDTVTGQEGIEWLDCLLDAVCLEDDYGAYETLYNAVWGFPRDMVGRRLAEYLPSFQRRMSFAPSQVWRFYIPVHQTPQSQDAFIQAAKNWDETERKTGMGTIVDWSSHSAKEEADWMPVLLALGYAPPAPEPTDPIPAHWPEELKEKLRVWRELPPDDTSKKVFWSGSKATDEQRWADDLPYLVEALALRHGAKWRDVVVWLNPFGTFAMSLYDSFVDALSKASPEIRDKALENIKRVRPTVRSAIHEELKQKLYLD